MGARIFFVHEDESIHRFACSKFDAVLERNLALPEYAGKRVRYAHVTLEIKARRPVSVQRVDCSTLAFDDKGYWDVSERERDFLDMAILAGGAPRPRTGGKRGVVDASYRFAIKRRDDKLWKPSRRVMEAIEASIFKGRKQR